MYVHHALSFMPKREQKIPAFSQEPPASIHRDWTVFEFSLFFTVGSICSGLHVTDGSVTCSNSGDKTVCRVHCEGEDKGKFTCTEDEGWTPELPTCAKPIEGADNEEVLNAENAGCPVARLCMKACQEQGKRVGRCTGKLGKHCICS
ncbi:hypothetical protein AVEN_98629-1 [Araneus ventricosus]|uniref:Sushi domain-containing protein n=1 Tax=Araneus ventricosus TaxID=182803 RepID=A0A4Y2U1E2_ARAVE|nr:hypothetical protein AVEN_98629-1 [Araneus ventricosus]